MTIFKKVEQDSPCFLRVAQRLPSADWGERGDCMAEGCIASDQPLRAASATAVTPCFVPRIEEDAMLNVLHREHVFFGPICRVLRLVVTTSLRQT